MTRKKLPAPTVDRHVDLYESDCEFIEARFGRSSATRFGFAKFIREVVHSKVKALRAKEQEALDEMGGEEPGPGPKPLQGSIPEVSSEEIL